MCLLSESLLSGMHVNRIWDYSDPLVPLKQTTDHHTEFTYSVDFSIHRVGLIADCSWDKTVKVYIPAYLST
jgi:hypothetical protein